ncbi:hypothetical protein [Amycolatopsis sp. NPDC051102]|uniref:hypothetical protein n=1 Tax=Amycolatopsis sp. NPDC051102 TaxID=3155163 RepID=UPI0034377550
MLATRDPAARTAILRRHRTELAARIAAEKGHWSSSTVRWTVTTRTSPCARISRPRSMPGLSYRHPSDRPFDDPKSDFAASLLGAAAHAGHLGSRSFKIRPMLPKTDQDHPEQRQPRRGSLQHCPKETMDSSGPATRRGCRLDSAAERLRRPSRKQYGHQEWCWTAP